MIGSPILVRKSIGEGEGVGRGKGVDGFVDFVWTFPTCKDQIDGFFIGDGFWTVVLAGVLWEMVHEMLLWLLI